MKLTFFYVFPNSPGYVRRDQKRLFPIPIHLASICPIHLYDILKEGFSQYNVWRWGGGVHVHMRSSKRNHTKTKQFTKNVPNTSLINPLSVLSLSISLISLYNYLSIYLSFFSLAFLCLYINNFFLALYLFHYHSISLIQD